MDVLELLRAYRDAYGKDPRAIILTEEQRQALKEIGIERKIRGAELLDPRHVIDATSYKDDE